MEESMNEQEVKELHIKLWGRVQGVNMRRNLSKYAEVLGLKGYVENLTDGSVSVLAQGEEDPLTELLQWCQKAVFPANVTGMSYEWAESTKKYSEFRIRREKSFVKDQAKSISNLGKEIVGVKRAGKIPTHVVIIADGNRRWARQKGWKPWVGHQRGGDYKRLKAIFEECKDLGVKYVSIWVWSTENWNRSEEEREAILNIFRKWFEKAKEELVREEICFRHIGRDDRLPRDIVEKLKELEEATKKNSELNVQLCMDYGGRDEIVRAVNTLIDSGVKGVTEETFPDFLDTAGIPDPDLVIRTSGEKRTSGMMPYQATYAELYFTNVPFPEFDGEELKRAILEYSHRTRRFGGTSTEELKNVDDGELTEPEGNDSEVGIS